MTATRRTLTLALLLVAAGSLAFATGAAVIDGDADTVADGDLAIQPADGPNGRYAYLNDDEIAIDVSASNPNIEDPSFEGVNVDTTGRIDNVFTITYTADEYAHVWIEYASENVTFVADGDSIEGEANNVTLAPNETVTVGLALDTRGATVGTRLGADEFSIEARIAEPNETETTSGTTRRTGDGGPTVTVASPSADRREFVASGVEGGEEVRFLTEGMEIDRENVTLEGIDLAGVRNERVELDAEGSPDPFADAGALTAPTSPRPVGYLSLDYDFAPDAVDAMTIRFSADRDYLNATGTDPGDVELYRRTDAGDWESKPVAVVDEAVVDILGLPEDRVHFRATTTEFSTFAVATREPRFDVTAATVSPEAIDPGENVTVRATVRNGGGAAGERAVTLTADGNSVASETVALAPNETATLSFDETVSAAGAYDLAVGGTPAGTLLVGDPGGDPAGGEGSNSEATGGDGESAETASGSDAASSAADTEAGPTEEPGGIEFVELGGLLAALALAVAGLALFRRMPRS
ncbi:CARDB domain-containing protein [Halorubrum ezzemoulense]|uniref:CARDB domain-containing protein n=1 Tax=Halorubrum ezzemoulense TaxID=337243 RepID=UPI00232F7449|nr:CARDB domain-containing protein [Halorubrum ezzemoulense]MDB2275156.1 CARDB domain-containing protein [Halorubrum ezzemoulense]